MDAQSIVRTLHILFGIVWLGQLYFFNLVNLPIFKFNINNGDPNQKAGPHLAFRILFWFRWGAMATLVFGLVLLYQLASAAGMGAMDFLTASAEGKNLAIGMALGIIMWFNVWFIIWPNQKVVLGNNIKIAKGVADDEKKKLEADNAPRAKNAKLASRVNFWLSLPMLLFMVLASHSPWAW